jgi:hypothetical protein
MGDSPPSSILGAITRTNSPPRWEEVFVTGARRTRSSTQLNENLAAVTESLANVSHRWFCGIIECIIECII